MVHTEVEDQPQGLSTPTQTLLSRDVFFGVNRYVEYVPGDTNLIVSIPHGGYLKPSSIPDRTPGCRDRSGVCQFPCTSPRSTGQECAPSSDKCPNCQVIVGGDSFTQEIGKLLVKEIQVISGKTPYVILSHLHRVKLDPNRPIEEAAFKDPQAERAYEEYHNFIREAKTSLGRPGLLIDLHGQNHHQNSTELGYLFMRNDLNTFDFTKDIPSINSLLKRSGLTVEQLLYGEKSLGALFESAGYRAVPSPRQPVPGQDKYYRGGYITQVHGSRSGGDIDAIQIEVPQEIREWGGDQLRTSFARTLARILLDFHNMYYNMD